MSVLVYSGSKPLTAPARNFQTVDLLCVSWSVTAEERPTGLHLIMSSWCAGAMRQHSLRSLEQGTAEALGPPFNAASCPLSDLVCNYRRGSFREKVSADLLLSEEIRGSSPSAPVNQKRNIFFFHSTALIGAELVLWKFHPKPQRTCL